MLGLPIAVFGVLVSFALVMAVVLDDVVAGDVGITTLSTSYCDTSKKVESVLRVG